MAQKKIQTIIMDGTLTQAEALTALSEAALTATNALPDALQKCKNREEMQQIIADRDTCRLAYTNALGRSLQHTGPLFEQTANDLGEAAKKVNKEVNKLKSATDAINLLADLARLSAKLALAFA